ncbi:MAG TPA: NUDIX domain-containing protein [Candidatus Polarisedimenticolia bacterium]|nr:NUDIX domain-containing protein [Candidatus Polarisedimenticolia bacterium]
MSATDGLFIPAVSVLAFRDGRLLSLKRSLREEKAPGAWEVISGRIEPGEQPLEAAAREAREESGLELDIDPRPIASYRGEVVGRNMLVVAYRAEAPAQDPTISDEHDDWAFVTLEEFAARCPFPRLVAVASVAAGAGAAAAPGGTAATAGAPARCGAHVLVWEFAPAAGREAEFERAYGPDGDWARLFRRDPAYLGTELLRGPAGRYLTLDRWRTRAAFEAFKKREAVDYAVLDRRMEALTSHEASLGTFDTPAMDVPGASGV